MSTSTSADVEVGVAKPDGMDVAEPDERGMSDPDERGILEPEPSRWVCSCGSLCCCTTPNCIVLRTCAIELWGLMVVGSISFKRTVLGVCPVHRSYFESKYELV